MLYDTLLTKVQEHWLLAPINGSFRRAKQFCLAASHLAEIDGDLSLADDLHFLASIASVHAYRETNSSL